MKMVVYDTYRLKKKEKPSEIFGVDFDSVVKLVLLGLIKKREYYSNRCQLLKCREIYKDMKSSLNDLSLQIGPEVVGTVIGLVSQYNWFALSVLEIVNLPGSLARINQCLAVESVCHLFMVCIALYTVK
ncbi:hypothetical protein PHYBLDRAFT_174945 [Phycomyces blakesleeanus NRRL 1555(-)]|uniref:Uncharacterized protein n=1 Tax=Phycomyces blakesleeanus (strain ATCC 8743b / DSM 1359 / FGSC 10004 / NBRC 33097 / NRRL 1555) TaxID=763407 RepID=A0A162ZH02_PHYB8|nr:hypothetical protein PHYBLDRAFT_174945 [Phycomyces blakesleeanus NRRL 1555(-)]OAD66651.1 hypothetical protein PHYBLDRAFT_174945 [Phycomyces blakesleeanus NRRL 1555(-)]|eukprot:XP_018284691.1 hypothetical protein PHYBLDRAFT_174945 [Phycomyces blakesleeanus NRRL 1555(-)]